MQHKIVSSEQEELILVDESDNEIGFLGKGECHDGDAVLHRAFSVFLFDSHGRLLMQQRGSDKRLWPGFWSNSCCSHPRRGETLAYATQRRLSEELGVSSVLQYAYRFSYHARFGAAGSEHELCSVYLGRCGNEVHPNATEIDEIRFLRADEVQADMATRPEVFTPWFLQEWACLCGEHAVLLKNYTSELQDS